jgi:exosome complex exonuclease RRP6
MLRYAREDTHYLLYIYDLMRQELIAKGFSKHEDGFFYLRHVIHKSTSIALKTYEKPLAKDYNYYMILGRNTTLHSRSEFSSLKALLKWRDYIARLEDESTYYIMPNHVLFQIGRDLPQTLN